MLSSKAFKLINSFFVKLKGFSINHIALYLIICLPFALYLIITIPPSLSHDEMEHYFRVTTIADGQIIAENAPKNHFVNEKGDNSDIPNANLGGLVNEDVYNLMTYNFVAHEKYDFPYAFTNSSLTSEENAKQDVNIAFTNTSVYSPITYAPYILGYKISIIVSDNAKTDYILTKIISLLLFALMIAFIIYLAPPFIRNFITVFVLLPNIITGFASVTSDSMNIIITLLFIVMLINAIIGIKNAKNLKRSRLAVFSLSIILLAFIKITLFPFIGLLILLPIAYNYRKQNSNYSDKSTFVREKITIIISTITSTVFFAIWYILAGKGDIRGYYFSEAGGVSSMINEIFCDPLVFINKLTNTLFFDKDSVFSKVFIDNQYNYSQDIFIFALIISFIMYVALKQLYNYSKLPNIENSKIVKNVAKSSKTIANILVNPKIARIIISIFITLQIVGTFIILYLTFTPHNQNSIWGVQGRYFLPLIPLLMLYIIYPLLVNKNDGLLVSNSYQKVKFFTKDKTYLLYITLTVILIFYCSINNSGIYTT